MVLSDVAGGTFMIPLFWGEILMHFWIQLMKRWGDIDGWIPEAFLPWSVQEEEACP